MVKYGVQETNASSAYPASLAEVCMLATVTTAPLAEVCMLATVTTRMLQLAKGELGKY